jgi:hypothetical protein
VKDITAATKVYLQSEVVFREAVECAKNLKLKECMLVEDFS